MDSRSRHRPKISVFIQICPMRNLPDSRQETHSQNISLNWYLSIEKSSGKYTVGTGPKHQFLLISVQRVIVWTVDSRYRPKILFFHICPMRNDLAKPMDQSDGTLSILFFNHFVLSECNVFHVMLLIFWLFVITKVFAWKKSHL